MTEFYKHKVEAGEIEIDKVPLLWKKRVELAMKKEVESKGK